MSFPCFDDKWFVFNDGIKTLLYDQKDIRQLNLKDRAAIFFFFFCQIETINFNCW